MTDAEAGRWKQVLAHAELVESLGHTAVDEFDAVDWKYLPYADLVHGLADKAQAYWDSGSEVGLEISLGERSSLSVRSLQGDRFSDPSRLESALGDCPHESATT